MALLDRDVGASVDASTALVGPQLSGDLIAAVDLESVSACRIHSDGKVYYSDGSAADAEARVDGFTPKKYKAGQSVELYGPGVRFGYGSGLTPGANYYLAVTPGRLDTAATTGGVNPIARAVNATDIVILAKQ
jgi:hypothetical protein